MINATSFISVESKICHYFACTGLNSFAECENISNVFHGIQNGKKSMDLFRRFQKIFKRKEILVPIIFFNPVKDISYIITISKHNKCDTDFFSLKCFLEICGSLHGIRTYIEVYGMKK